jgi:tetratricopeptide (TPR) repeat protein
MASTRPFRAFVSYSHADSAFAAWLQRKLESYRLPRRLADRLEPLPGQPQGRIGPVFRDRADLSAATDLSAAVREGIAASSALVVVASPDAARSPWVAREIDLFRDLHPDAPVLVALVRGESGEAVPEALRAGGLHPLAADFRKQGDGKRLAFLKIVAGLADLPLDALVQRDAQRQVRRVTGVTLAAAVLVLIMALLLVMALRAREEAERQRAEAQRQRGAAEGLVEFMLTDLRQGLKRVGRLDVMGAVNARALAYYSSQANLSQLPDDSLERRARILHVMGEDADKSNELESALAKFTEARRTTAAVLARNPVDPRAIFDHAQSEFWVGYAAERRSDWPRALAHYRAYAAASKRLIAIDPASPDYMMEAGFGESNIGKVRLLSRAGPDFGRTQFLKAIAWFEKAARARPRDSAIQDELGNGYANLADSFYLEGDFQRSLAARQRELAFKAAIEASDPANNAARFQRAKAQFAVAANLRKLGRDGEARPLLAVAGRDLGELLALEPRNREWSEVAKRIRKAMK